MVKIDFDDKFKNTLFKIKDISVKERIEKQILKIANNPEVGKPMRYNRKGTREVYIGSHRLSYAYIKDRDTIKILDFYHKDEQ